MRVRPCVICGTKRKGMHFWLCKPCAVKWGCYRKPFSQWPEWVRGLKRMAEKQEYTDKKYGKPIPTDPIILERMIDNTANNGSGLP